MGEMPEVTPEQIECDQLLFSHIMQEKGLDAPAVREMAGIMVDQGGSRAVPLTIVAAARILCLGLQLPFNSTDLVMPDLMDELLERTDKNAEGDAPSHYKLMAVTMIHAFVENHKEMTQADWEGDVMGDWDPAEFERVLRQQFNATMQRYRTLQVLREARKSQGNAEDN